MGRIKRIIAAGIATVMLGMPCVDAMGSVHAEEETQQQSTLEMPVLTSIKLENAYGADISNITTPAQFDVEVGIKAPEGMNISGVRLSFGDGDVGVGDFNRHFDSSKQENWAPGEAGGTVTVPVVFNKYVPVESKILTEVDIYVEDDQNSGAYTSYVRTWREKTLKGSWHPAEQQESDITDVFEYDGSVDYVITTSEEGDTKGPIVTSVEVVNSSVSQQETVVVNLHYKEEGSGINYAYVSFISDSGKQEYFEFQNDSGEDYAQEGILQLSSTLQREAGEEYKLQSVGVEDREKNYRGYYRANDQTDYLTEYEGGLLPVISYKVKSEEEQANPNYLLVQGIRVAEGVDKNNIAAGDSIDVIVTLKNNTGSACVLLGGSLRSQWVCNNKIEYVNIRNYQDIVIEAGVSTEITLTYNIGEFVQKGAYQWLGVDYCVGEYLISYGRTDTGVRGQVEQYGQVVAQLPEFTYEGAADFAVVKADKPDIEAPYIKDIQIGTTDIKAPGEVKIELKVEDGNAKAKSVTLGFVDIENNQNTMYISGTIWGANSVGLMDNMYYSETKRCYVIEGELGAKIAKGNYQLFNVDILDQAQQSRNYGDIQDGILTDWTDGTTLESVQMKVVESERKDRDFVCPTLKHVEVVNKEIATPGELEYIVNAEDESGVSDIHFQYKRSDGTYLSFYADNIIKNGNNYICKVKLGQYVWGDLCELTSVMLEDGSEGKNRGYYSRRNNELYCGQNGLAVAYNGEGDISLRRSEEDATLIYIGDQEMDSKLQAFENGTAVTITGLYPARADNRLSAETMRIIKDKKLKLRLIMPTGKDQILIDGTELTDEMIQEFYLVFGEKFKLSNSISFINAVDNAGYGIYLEGENNRIPMTIRIAVDKEFYENYKESNIRFSKNTYTVNGYQIEKENLKLTLEEGEYFVDVPVDAGQEVEYGYYYISTDTTKLFDYVIDTEAWIETATNEVVKGNEFTHKIRISNDNEETLKNIVVYPEMLNKEDGTEIDISGAYRFSVVEGEAKEKSTRTIAALANSDKVIIDEEGDAIIKELKKGEEVELSLHIQIPETLEAERIALNTFAAIVKSDTELEAFGSTNVNLTLRRAKTVILGDVNEDGVVDAGDLMYMLQVVSERISEADLSTEQIKAADVAGADGKITADDLMKMLQFVSERISTLE